MTSSQVETKNLEERLRQVEARLEIIELEGTYARSFDDRDGDTWSSLFTPDGIYQARVIDGEQQGSFVQGTEALRDFCTNARFTGIHFLHLPQVQIDGDRAQARIHLEFYGSFTNDRGAPFGKTIGYYDVAYRRVDGRWRIEKRVTTTFASETRSTFGYLQGNGLQDS